MTMKKRKEIASTIRKIVLDELPNSWLRQRERHAILKLVSQAQQMGLEPETVLSDSGRDALTVIARAIFTAARVTRPHNTLRAEWALIVKLGEREALAS